MKQSSKQLMVAGALTLLAASPMMAGTASAEVLTFDDLTTNPSDTQYPSIFAGPIGFVEDGYQFSGNEVVYNVSGIANGPAYSGNYAAFNDYSGYGAYTGPTAFYTTVTKVGGGTFSFYDAYLQSWSHSAGDSISGSIAGYSAGGTLVGIQFFSDVLGWTDVSATGAIGTFDNITSLVFAPSDLTLIDNLQVDATTPAVPEPATWAMMLVGIGCVGVGLRTRRKKSMIAA